RSACPRYHHSFPTRRSSDLRSENFSPVGVRRNVYNELQAPPTGTTKEFGLMFDLFGGKISARVNHFETAGEGFTDAALQPAINRDRKSTRLNSSHLGISYAV